jgi:hypothetical protein
MKRKQEKDLREEGRREKERTRREQRRKVVAKGYRGFIRVF